MKEAMFVKGGVCNLCPHNCLIKESGRGVCGVRINKRGRIYSLSYGHPCSIAVDPIEKKPLYHFFPGKKILSFGTFGCNFFCKGCQNWEIARKISNGDDNKTEYTPKMMIALAKKEDCKMIAYTYNEPTVFYEYVLETAKEARKNGLKNVIVSNGYINKEPLLKLSKYIDAANIDLKVFDETLHLKYTGGKLKHVLNSLKILKKEGVWLEITHLIIPGWNDDLRKCQKSKKISEHARKQTFSTFEEMCIWIKDNLGKDTPLHLSRFFPYYTLSDVAPTPIETLHKARDMAKKYLDYVYIGNVDEESNTYCPKCNSLLIRRERYNIKDNTVKGECFNCKKKVLGILKN